MVHARITIIYSLFFKYNKTNVYTSETPTLNLYCTIVYYANALYNVTCIFMLFVYASMF